MSKLTERQNERKTFRLKSTDHFYATHGSELPSTNQVSTKTMNRLRMLETCKIFYPQLYYLLDFYPK